MHYRLSVWIPRAAIYENPYVHFTAVTGGIVTPPSLVLKALFMSWARLFPSLFPCFPMGVSAGNAVMKGYLKNERATTEAFDQAR